MNSLNFATPEIMQKLQRSPAILQVIPQMQYGGVEIEAMDVARHLARSGWISVLAAHNATKCGPQDGVVLIDMPVHSKHPMSIAANARRLETLIRDMNIDLVHARSRAPAWSALIAARRTGIPLVTTVHGAYDDGPFGIKRPYNSVMMKGHRVAAVSDFIRDYITARFPVPEQNICKIISGIDLAFFDPANVDAQRVEALRRAWRLPSGIRVVLLPGRVTRAKGHATAVRALAQLPGDVHMVFVGAVNEESAFHQELRNIQEQFGLQGRVHFPGAGSDMPAAYMLSDIVVFPSVRPESFGRVVIEAQAMGRPVIASDHGGPRETIEHGRTGWLVEPDNAYRLAEQITQLLHLEPSVLAGIRQDAMAFSRSHFDLQKMTQDTINMYAEALYPSRAS